MFDSLGKTQNAGQYLTTGVELGLSLVISDFSWVNMATAGQLVNPSDIYLNERRPLITSLLPLCVCVCASVLQGEVSQMAPKGFAVIASSPGIRPLGFICINGFLRPNQISGGGSRGHRSGAWVGKRKKEEKNPLKTAMPSAGPRKQAQITSQTAGQSVVY